MSQPDYNKAFQDGACIEYADQNGRDAMPDRYTLHTHRIGELIATSGQIVICDPLFMFDTPPLINTISPGQYPVILSVAEAARGDQRVACALLRLNEHSAVRWELAALQEQRPSLLNPEVAFGYSVDFGTACFVDAAVPQRLLARIDAGEDVSGHFYDALDDMQKRTYVDTWSWADTIVDDVTGANIIAFSSGWGDGFYHSYWGYDAADQRVALVTDFRVLTLSWLEQ